MRTDVMKEAPILMKNSIFTMKNKIKIILFVFMLKHVHLPPDTLPFFNLHFTVELVQRQTYSIFNQSSPIATFGLGVTTFPYTSFRARLYGIRFLGIVSQLTVKTTPSSAMNFTATDKLVRHGRQNLSMQCTLLCINPQFRLSQFNVTCEAFIWRPLLFPIGLVQPPK